jgi:predicted aspartyl protease
MCYNAPMIGAKEKNMGRFSVEVELANDVDLVQAEAGAIPMDQVRRERIRGVVDTGATRLVIPEALAKRLDLKISGTTQVRYADGRTAQRQIARRVHLTFGDRDSIFNAIVEPGRDSALIGAIVLEDLDLIIDCTTQQLRPRDPKQIVSEVE